MNECFSWMRRENQPAVPGLGPVSGVWPWQCAHSTGRLFGLKPPASLCALRMAFSLLWQPVDTQVTCTETGATGVARANSVPPTPRAMTCASW